MKNNEKLPTDDYSLTLSQLLNNPTALQSSSTIDALTFLGNNETWIAKTVRVEGNETIFLQVIDAQGGRRFIVPPAVVAALVRQRDQLLATSRKRAARQAVITRKANGGKK